MYIISNWIQFSVDTTGARIEFDAEELFVQNLSTESAGSDSQIQSTTSTVSTSEFLGQTTHSTSSDLSPITSSATNATQISAYDPANERLTSKHF